MGWVLSDITQFFVFIIQIVWVPWMSICLDEFRITIFMTEWLKKMGVSEGKWKQISTVFETQKLKLSGKFVNKMKSWAPLPLHCHIYLRLVITVGAYPIPFHFSPKFLLKIFPLLTSLSQPLLFFTSLFIPSELALWHHSLCSKHWTRPEKNTAWLKNNSWS